MSYRIIAEETGVSKSEVHRIAKDMGLVRARKGDKDERKD